METLLIDPNLEHIQLFLDALENKKIANQIHTVSNGSDAIDFLRQRGDYTDAPPPNLILLEVDLPEMDGYELLDKLNDNPELAETPVIILTASDEAKAVARSYDLHANAYIEKPVDPDEFTDAVRSLEEFWLEIAWLPPDEE